MPLPAGRDAVILASALGGAVVFVHLRQAQAQGDSEY